MKNFLTKLDKWFDIYIVWFLYNGNKKNRYYGYLKNKWGDKI